MAILPGSIFGPSGEGLVRMSYAASLEEIEQGVNIFKNFLADIYPA